MISPLTYAAESIASKSVATVASTHVGTMCVSTVLFTRM